MKNEILETAIYVGLVYFVIVSLVFAHRLDQMYIQAKEQNIVLKQICATIQSHKNTDNEIYLNFCNLVINVND